MTYAPFELAILKWINRVTGTLVQFARQNVPQPSVDFVLINLLNVSNGQSQEVHSNVMVGGVYPVNTHIYKNGIVRIEAYGDSSVIESDKIQRSLLLRDVGEYNYSNNLTVSTLSRIGVMDNYSGPENFNRCICDYRFRFKEKIVEVTREVIESVVVPNNLTPDVEAP